MLLQKLFLLLFISMREALPTKSSPASYLLPLHLNLLHVWNREHNFKNSFMPTRGKHYGTSPIPKKCNAETNYSEVDPFTSIVLIWNKWSKYCSQHIILKIKLEKYYIFSSVNALCQNEDNDSQAQQPAFDIVVKT